MQAEAVKGESRALSPFVLAAGTYVACGLMPIPLERGGKRPVFDWKKLQGQGLVDQEWDKADEYILRWWGRPDPYNIGVLTGTEIYLDETRMSGLVVVDVDDEAARQLVERECDWPLTPTVRTSKGWHLWLVDDEPRGNRARVDGVGLDIRGEGGYVVAPPSVHPSGHVYTWDISPNWGLGGIWPPETMPGPLAALIWPPKRPMARLTPTLERLADARQDAKQHARRYVMDALMRELEAVRSAPEGARNDQLNRSAYAIARFVPSKLSESEFRAAFLDAALAAGLGESESEATISSALRGRR